VEVEYNLLDMEAKFRALDGEEMSRLKYLGRELQHLWALEEIKVRQHSRDGMILEGDRNIAYFQAMVNCRHRKKD
jgi:hypothetical protein